MTDTHTHQPSMDAAAPGPPASASDILKVRVVAGIIFVASLGLLLVSAWLNPSGEGMGTHSQLGLPPCGMLETTGIPCATCGMTTAFAYAADGRLIRSFITQPAGALLAIAVATTVIASGFTLLTGMNMASMFKGLLRPVPLLGMGLVVALAWMYKVAVVTGFFPSL